MDKRLLVICSIFALALTFFSFPDGALSVMLILIIAIPTVALIRKYAEEKEFLTNVFFIALLFRIGLGTLIHVFDLRGLFGPDAITYDGIGQRMVEIWKGLAVPSDFYTLEAQNPGSSGWGMNYLVGSIYLIFGPSILAVQTFCGIIGALTAPMIYYCADNIFNNKRVSKLSALFIALFPSFIIWSSQLLKDGLIIFLLVCAMTAILQLRKNFNSFNVALLIFSLFGIFSLRFYIFYMVATSVVGSLVMGLNTTLVSTVRNTIIIILVGLTLTYLGVIRNATSDFEKYGNLERIQISRQYLATSAGSGFGEDVDVSTTSGAISTIPIGLLYLFFAPFPWEVTKLSQALVLPETFVWWALIPIFISGLWYTLKNKLRGATPILLFSLMLSISYAIFQGNVGMLYRQRTQLQVFLFIFIAVGWTIIRERRENRNILAQAKKNQLRKKIQVQQVKYNHR